MTYFTGSVPHEEIWVAPKDDRLFCFFFFKTGRKPSRIHHLPRLFHDDIIRFCLEFTGSLASFWRKIRAAGNLNGQKPPDASSSRAVWPCPGCNLHKIYLVPPSLLSEPEYSHSRPSMDSRSN
jgi:hypothetical protein